MPHFSIITAFRNRDLERVKNSLDSLAAQTVQDFELIFIDYGSDAEVSAQVKPLVESYRNAHYVYAETRGMFWSRAHSLNIGIRLANGNICVLWDIDFMAEPSFLEKLLGYNFNSNFLMIACAYLPQMHTLTYSSFEQVKQFASIGSGGMCVASKMALFSIDGFDEYYQVWGAEDDDLYRRLQIAGLQRKQTDATELAVYHQWHATQSPALPDMWYLAMVEHLYAEMYTTNPDYGHLFTSENRHALRAFLSGTYKQFQKIELETGNKTLLYNRIIKESLLATDTKAYYIDYSYPQLGFSTKAQLFMAWFNRKMEKHKLNFRIINHQQQERKELQNNIYAFLKYFIGTRRAMWNDYYLHWHDKGFVLVYVMK